jgi:acetolactate synthase I/II/III large subunit
LNGAESLLTTLINNGVDVCFTNPGTSEMHFVAALDEVEGMRCVLCLFEGVLSGAADGYARMAGKPASTLLHLGPGLGNALANIHNTHKGNMPLINIVGDHATYHIQYDAPLTSDIEGIARPVSDWVYTSQYSADIARDASEAVVQAGWDRVATLVLPADVSWGDNPGGAMDKVERLLRPQVPAQRVAEAASRLRNAAKPLILIGGPNISAEQGLMLNRIGQACGASVLTETFPVRVARGAGTAVMDKLPYLAEMAIDLLKDADQLILLGAKSPVSFFAYPGVPSVLSNGDCEPFVLADTQEDINRVLSALVLELGAGEIEPQVHALAPPELPQGDFTAAAVGQAIGHLLPEDTIIVDEANTSGMVVTPFLAAARAHDCLNLTGGSIGWGLPAAVGAAIACPERKVLCLEGDGSAMYTIQALWTMARENLDITVVIFNNRKYSILELEFGRTGARGGVPGPKAASMLAIGGPDLDFVELARGMGVRAERADSTEAFNRLFEEAMASRGPRLIDALVPPIFP